MYFIFLYHRKNLENNEKRLTYHVYTITKRFPATQVQS